MPSAKQRVKAYLGYSDTDPDTVQVSSWLKARVHDLGPVVSDEPCQIALYSSFVDRAKTTFAVSFLSCNGHLGTILPGYMAIS